jgi:hypothetical protein
MKKLTITIPLPDIPVRLTPLWGALLAALLLVPSFFWIAEDRRVWPWDQAWYGEVSVNSWYWLNHSPVRWVQTMADDLNLKPPAIVWIGQFFVPLKHLLGSVEVSLLSFVALTQLVLLLILFKIGSIISPKSLPGAASGVMFAVGAQLFVGLSHQYFVEPLQAVAVAWAFVIALQARERPGCNTLLHLVANLTFGLLVKASTPAYCWIPWLYSLSVVLKKRKDISFSDQWKLRRFRAFATVTAALAIVGVLWYLRHLRDVWRHVREASSSDIALEYGARDTVLHKLGTWLTIVDQSFFSPYVGWACVIAVCVAAVSLWQGRHSRSKEDSDCSPIAFLSVVQVASLLLLFSINIGVDARYAYAMLPCLAILFIRVCVALPRNAIVAMLLLCGARWAIVSHASFAEGKGIENQSEWLYGPQRDGTEFDELTRAVRFTSTGADRYNMIAVEYPWLNANSAAFLAAENRLTTGVRSAYVSIGYAQKDLDSAMRRIAEFHVVYIVTLAPDSQDPTPNFLNVVSRALAERVEHDDRFMPLQFPSKTGIMIFEARPDVPVPAAAGAQPGIPQSDLTIVPPEIARARIEKRGHSSLDVVNSSFAKQDRSRRTFLVRAGSGNIGSCVGWAYDDLQKSTPENAWLELTNADTMQHFYWPTHRYERPELATALKIPSIKKAGFNCEQVNFSLPAGTYLTRVYQLEGSTVIVSDLNTYESSPTIVVK